MNQPTSGWVYEDDLDLRPLMSDVKFYEGYSRFSEQLGRYETWDDACSRVMSMHRSFYKDKMTPELEAAIATAEVAYKNREVLGAQRALQFGGDQLLKHQMKMYNCTSSYADRAAFFGEFFYILLCGAGAGFSVQKHHVAKMPKIAPRTKQAKTHVLEDSIEGWGTGLDVLLSSFFVGGGVHPEYEGRKVYFDPSNIRDKGALISGGFKAPGPEPLMRALLLIERVITNRLITGIADYGILRPIDVYDICMHAADAVLAGGVRRAATICLFSLDDIDMLMAKTGDWFEQNPQRARSNNSVVIHRTLDADMSRYIAAFGKVAELLGVDIDDSMSPAQAFFTISKVIRQFGEPGFVFVDSYEHCFNPCVEIGMFPQTESGISGWQGCNLVEINGAKCDTREAFLRACYVATVMGTLQAGYTNFKFLQPETKQIFDREALLGVSLTGWMNNPHVLLDEETLAAGVSLVKETNEKIATILGINPAARLTCVKPAGNASVLLGTASGVHPEHAPRFLRSIQVNKMQDVCEAIKAMNPYMMEDSIWSQARTDYSIAFPVIAPEHSIFRDGVGAIDFLTRVKFIQKHWVTAGTIKERCVDPTVRHNVSNTVTVKEDEWEAVFDYLWNNRNDFTGVSFTTPRSDYYQSPFQEVLLPEQIVEKYGAPALFAAGLIVDSIKGFKHLWDAIFIAQYNNDPSSQEDKDTHADWIRRFKKFAQHSFGGDLQKTGDCLKDVYLLHKWEKIQQSHTPVNIVDFMQNQRQKDINTMGAIACAAGGCEI